MFSRVINLFIQLGLIFWSQAIETYLDNYKMVINNSCYCYSEKRPSL